MRRLMVVLGISALALVGCSPGAPTLDQAPIDPEPNMVFADMSYWSTPAKYATCDVQSKDLVVDQEQQVWVYRLAPVCQNLSRHMISIHAWSSSIDLYGENVDEIEHVEDVDPSRYTHIEDIQIIGDLK